MIGMLIYEMFHNTTPFKGDTPTQLFKSILSDKVNQRNPNDLDRVLDPCQRLPDRP